ncbi:class I SAM-dependent methyltransferase [Corynebacterium amycolatum]|uniref:class I SAM-dependent methyltransferase n=1 Tax=Corynebacterium amycolatum TaxID=43765 RepID=UPI003AF9B353
MVAMSNGNHNHRTWKEIIAADPQHSRRYANRWRGFVREGRDIDGEARLVDAMAPRHARILDAGCGQGRVGGYLAKAGHQVVGVDVDPYLIDEAKRQFPDATWLVGDLAQLPHVLDDGLENTPHGDTASAFDVIICPGNVLTFIAPEDRTKVLQGFAAALNPEGGRAIIGFGAGRGWDFADFETTSQEAELIVIQRYSTWDLRPFDAESQFLVAVLERG